MCVFCVITVCNSDVIIYNMQLKKSAAGLGYCLLWNDQLNPCHVEVIQHWHVIQDVMICAVNVATWELFPMLHVKRLAVRPTKLLLLVTVEWYLRNAAMEEVIFILKLAAPIKCCRRVLYPPQNKPPSPPPFFQQWTWPLANWGWGLFWMQCISKYKPHPSRYCVGGSNETMESTLALSLQPTQQLRTQDTDFHNSQTNISPSSKPLNLFPSWLWRRPFLSTAWNLVLLTVHIWQHRGGGL